MYLAFDPGKTTGWAMFEPDNGMLVDSGQASLEQLMSLCREWETLDLQGVIYEQFRVFRHKAMQQTGSKMEVAQAIGIIKSLAHHKNLQPVVQESNIKSIAEKWTGIKVPADHSISHRYDAILHGSYHLIGKGIAKSRLQIEEEAKRNAV